VERMKRINILMLIFILTAVISGCVNNPGSLEKPPAIDEPTTPPG